MRIITGKSTFEVVLDEIALADVRLDESSWLDDASMVIATSVPFFSMDRYCLLLYAARLLTLDCPFRKNFTGDSSESYFSKRFDYSCYSWANAWVIKSNRIYCFHTNKTNETASLIDEHISVTHTEKWIEFDSAECCILTTVFVNFATNVFPIVRLQCGIGWQPMNGPTLQLKWKLKIRCEMSKHKILRCQTRIIYAFIFPAFSQVISVQSFTSTSLWKSFVYHFHCWFTVNLKGLMPLNISTALFILSSKFSCRIVKRKYSLLNRRQCICTWKSFRSTQKKTITLWSKVVSFSFRSSPFSYLFRFCRIAAHFFS